MSINVLNIKNSLQNLITKNNTNTSDYDVSADLDGRVKFISGGTAVRVPVLNISYPAVFVALRNVEDKHVELGMSARRDTELMFQITGIIDFGIATDITGEKSDNEIIQLSQNLENLFRNKITLSATVDSCLVTETDYIVAGGTYNSHANINLLINKRG